MNQVTEHSCSTLGKVLRTLFRKKKKKGNMLFVIKKKQSLLFVVKTKQHKNKKSGNPQMANQLMVCICGPSLCTHAPEEDSGLPGVGM